MRPQEDEMTMDLRRKPGTPEHRQYQERVRQQTLAWAQGRPYHNNLDDECCPDFSCCQPALFETDEAARWALYHVEHGGKH
jgi:hypothetical protein